MKHEQVERGKGTENRSVYLEKFRGDTEEQKSKPSRAVKWLSDCIDLAVAFINGVAGDYIENRRSHLAIPMCFYRDANPVAISRESLMGEYPEATSRICIFVHGLCFNEKAWEWRSDPSKNFGSLLQQDFGYTPFFVRYNSGLHMSQNGRNLSDLIDRLLDSYPEEVKEIVLIGHSQGGLIIRSACHYGRENAAAWTSLVKRVFFLGTPHLGAPLEKFVNVLTSVMRSVKNAHLRSVADFLNFRSAGIKDLRFGYTLDEEWHDWDPDSLLQNRRHHMLPLEGVKYHAIASSLTSEPGHPVSWCIGDAMVRLPSATWQTSLSHGSDALIEHCAVIPGISHFELARHPDVYDQIRAWCQCPDSQPTTHGKETQ